MATKMMKNSESTLAAYDEMLLGSHHPHSQAIGKIRNSARMTMPKRRAQNFLDTSRDSCVTDQSPA